MSDFFGLQVGLSALYAARRSMEVSASNVANANTEGYSRQRVTVSSAGAPLTAAMFARSESQLSGVKVDKVIRTRDDFIQARVLAENSTQKFMERQQTILSRIELSMNEPSDTGISSQLADFWASWEDLANNPGSLATRSQLLERGRTIVDSVNQAAGDLRGLWSTSIDQLRTITAGVNATAARIAELNGSIKRALVAELSPNELLDQRDQLALELAQQVGGEIRTDANGTIGVFVGGTAVVRDETANDLEVVVPSGTNVVTVDDTAVRNVQLRWVKDAFRATVNGGEAGGLLDAVNRIIPGYRQELIGGVATSPVLTGAAVPAAALRQDFSAAPQSFEVVVNGVASTVTLNADLSDPATTAGDLAAALNNALAEVGVTGVTATGSGGASGTWTIELTGNDHGAAASITVQASGANTLASDLFGAVPATATGTGDPGQQPGVAYLLAKVVNLQHRQGVDLDGNDAGDFFTWDAIDGISVATTDPSAVGGASHAEGRLGGANALALADMSLLTGGPDDTYRNLIIRLGVEAQTANRRVDIQSNITNQVEAARDAESGVNIDEELAFMVAFQHSYGAASRLITAIDQMLTRLIDGTGLVGR